MSKILIAVDGSPDAMKAVEYIAQYVSRAEGLEVLLIHVLPNLPAIFWEEGHILSGKEKRERQNVIDKWLADRRAAMGPIFRKAAEVLAAQGIKQDAIREKTISDSLDVADSIIEAAKEIGAGTIVLGRHGGSEEGRHPIGAVANKIVHHAMGSAVIVVD